MGNILHYKDYTTHVEYSAEDNILTGTIEGINDLVNFEADTPADVEAAFHEAVDDYLAFCKDIGQEPDRPYKGSFNVRVKPQLHRQLDIAARKQGVSLNQIVEKALTDYVELKRLDEDTDVRTSTTMAVQAAGKDEIYRRQGLNDGSPYLVRNAFVN